MELQHTDLIEQKLNEVRCLLIPVQKNTLLLPNVSVAEVVPYGELIPQANAKKWHLGVLKWRQTSVPVISYERMNTEEEAIRYNRFSRLAVINSIMEHSKVPFWAMPIHGLPKLATLSESAIQETVGKIGFVDRMAVTAKGEPCIIPDLEMIEGQIQKELTAEG